MHGFSFAIWLLWLLGQHTNYEKANNMKKRDFKMRLLIKYRILHITYQAKGSN